MVREKKELEELQILKFALMHKQGLNGYIKLRKHIVITTADKTIRNIRTNRATLNIGKQH